MIPARIGLKIPYLYIMNRKKFYLLVICLGLAIGCYAQPEVEQDTLYAAIKEVKTFKVRKADADVIPPLLPTTVEDSSSLLLDKVEVLAEKVQRPSLAHDKKGLMQLLYLAPFSENGTTPKDTKYVVFSFEVDETGAVSDIRIFDTNDRNLVDILVSKLSGTIWNPATTDSGDATNYNFGRWIAAIPKNVNESDYERHRY